MFTESSVFPVRKKPCAYGDTQGKKPVGCFFSKPWYKVINDYFLLVKSPYIAAANQNEMM